MKPDLVKSVLTQKVAAIMVSVAAWGCAPMCGVDTPSIARCGEVAEHHATSYDWTARAYVRVTSESVDFPFELAIESRGETLTVVGFTSFGTKAFHVRQERDELDVENYIGAALPFPPENILIDVLELLVPRLPDSRQRVANETLTMDRPECGYSIHIVVLERPETKN